MARSREVLLLLGLLVVGLLAAAPGDAAAVRGCQPEVLAPTVALFCAPGQPAKWCCQALVHSASVSGGARCLCRLAAEEPLVRAWLNGTELLRLYASCRAARGGHAGGGAPSYPPAPSVCGCGERRARGHIGGVDGVPCFCHVPLLSSSFDVDRISNLYAACMTASDPGATPHLTVYMCRSNRV
uniref:Bifunctional inhibitor/plant lipid transfer protein/seed storage helical domain-containing protein n=1 Tax=Setaria viridis TaxID=4556 RepID=A0A4U6SXI9_SETVI|nr:hypothetical protein SEVIR_9G143400v2 [Setaria viridis]